jgi:signal transduction histidine kinase
VFRKTPGPFAPEVVELLKTFAAQSAMAIQNARLYREIAEKGLEFLASVPEDVPLAYGDGGRITQCLMNLAGNSLKFTKQGKVEIAVLRKDGLLRYSVSDTGIGIPPDKIESLFTEFKQTDAAIASEYGGTGLGLSITRKLMEMHGGRIWVESETGKGSRFIFEVPLRVASGAARQ